MSVFDHPAFDDHELVAFHRDPASGLTALVAVHNTRLGPGLGGCRCYPYANEADALTDVLRLSRGMTYKASLAGLPQGGGKSVIIADPRKGKTPAMMRAMGRLVESLSGKYVIAEDSGTDAADMDEVVKQTAYIGGGSPASRAADPAYRDTSQATAWGVFIGIRAAVRHRLRRDDLRGVRVAIQGVGKVGSVLAGHLRDAGAILWVADTHAPSAQRVAQMTGATLADFDALLDLDVDVLSPCALGAIFDDASIPRLKASIVAGAANNQLAEPKHDLSLRDRGVLYAPDYVINAGGIINIHYEGPNYRWATSEAHLQRIGTTLTALFERSAREGQPPGAVADRMAEEIFRA